MRTFRIIVIGGGYGIMLAALILIVALLAPLGMEVPQ